MNYVCNAVFPFCEVYQQEMWITDNPIGPLPSKNISKDDAKFFLDKLEEYYNLCEYSSPDCPRAKALRDILEKAGVL